MATKKDKYGIELLFKESGYGRVNRMIKDLDSNYARINRRYMDILKSGTGFEQHLTGTERKMLSMNKQMIEFERVLSRIQKGEQNIGLTGKQAFMMRSPDHMMIAQRMNYIGRDFLQHFSRNLQTISRGILRAYLKIGIIGGAVGAGVIGAGIGAGAVGTYALASKTIATRMEILPMQLAMKGMFGPAEGKKWFQWGLTGYMGGRAPFPLADITTGLMRTKAYEWPDEIRKRAMKALGGASLAFNRPLENAIEMFADLMMGQFRERTKSYGITPEMLAAHGAGMNTQQFLRLSKEERERLAFQGAGLRPTGIGTWRVEESARAGRFAETALSLLESRYGNIAKEMMTSMPGQWRYMQRMGQMFFYEMGKPRPGTMMESLEADFTKATDWIEKMWDTGKIEEWATTISEKLGYVYERGKEVFYDIFGDVTLEDIEGFDIGKIIQKAIPGTKDNLKDLGSWFAEQFETAFKNIKWGEIFDVMAKGAATAISKGAELYYGAFKEAGTLGKIGLGLPVAAGAADILTTGILGLSALRGFGRNARIGAEYQYQKMRGFKGLGGVINQRGWYTNPEVPGARFATAEEAKYYWMTNSQLKEYRNAIQYLSETEKAQLGFMAKPKQTFAKPFTILNQYGKPLSKGFGRIGTLAILGGLVSAGLLTAPIIADWLGGGESAEAGGIGSGRSPGSRATQFKTRANYIKQLGFDPEYLGKSSMWSETRQYIAAPPPLSSQEQLQNWLDNDPIKKTKKSFDWKRLGSNALGIGMGALNTLFMAKMAFPSLNMGSLLTGSTLGSLGLAGIAGGALGGAGILLSKLLEQLVDENATQNMMTKQVDEFETGKAEYRKGIKSHYANIRDKINKRYETKIAWNKLRNIQEKILWGQGLSEEESGFVFDIMKNKENMMPMLEKYPEFIQKAWDIKDNLDEFNYRRMFANNDYAASYYGRLRKSTLEDGRNKIYNLGSKEAYGVKTWKWKNPLQPGEERWTGVGGMEYPLEFAKFTGLSFAENEVNNLAKKPLFSPDSSMSITVGDKTYEMGGAAFTKRGGKSELELRRQRDLEMVNRVEKEQLSKEVTIGDVGDDFRKAAKDAADKARQAADALDRLSIADFKIGEGFRNSSEYLKQFGFFDEI